MQHGGTKIIETPRLILQRFTAGDATAMYQNWASSPNVCRYLTWQPHKNVEESSKIITMWEAQYPNPEFYQWAVERKQDHALIGSISMMHTSHDGYTGWMPGYCFGEAFWGQGYATETLDATVNYFFQNTNIDTLLCVHEEENTASKNTMQKIGFTFIANSTFPRQTGELAPACFYKLEKQNYSKRNL